MFTKTFLDYIVESRRIPYYHPDLKLYGPNDLILMYIEINYPYRDLAAEVKKRLSIVKHSRFVKTIKRKKPMYHYKERIHGSKHRSPIVSVSPAYGNFKESLHQPVRYDISVYGAKGICVRKFVDSISKEDQARLAEAVDWDYLCRRVQEEKETILTEGYTWLNT